MDIKGKVAIITGGASGLGEATTRRLVAEGAKVAIWDMNEEKGNKVAADLGENAYFAKIDVTNNDEVAAGIKQVVEKFGALHIIGNIAGRGKAVSIVGRDGNPCALEDFTQIIDLNLVASFNILRQGAAQMASQEPVNEDNEKGIVINTSSIASFHGQNGQQAYSASKGGLNSLSLPAARGLARHGIRVAAIAPGLFLTPIYDKVPQVLEGLKKDTVFPKRLGKPEEFASLFVEMVRNPMVNGDTYRLDGAVRF